MGCGCGKAAGAAKFVLVSPEGKETTFSTEIEAMAAKIRAGGGVVEQR